MNKRHDSSETWDLIIKPQKGFSVDLQLQEVWNYRELIYLFIRRNFVAYYKQTILGPLWYLITPFITTVVFTLIFGKLAKIPTDPISFLYGWKYYMELFCNQFQRNVEHICRQCRYFRQGIFPPVDCPDF